MTRRTVPVMMIVLTSALGALAACGGPAPDAVCEKYMELRKSAGKDAGDSEKSKCVDNLAALKERAPSSWNCASGCVENSKDLTAVETCPWSCEEQYGNDGERFKDTDKKLEIKERWEKGIIGDLLTDEEKAQAAMESAASTAAGAKAKVIEACVSECKGKTEGKPRAEYSKCFDACKTSKGM